MEKTSTLAESQQLAVALFSQRGLETKPLAKCGQWDTYHVVAPHDGVPYSLNPHNLRRDPSASQLDKNILHRKLTIERHHAMVKGIFDFCVKNGIEDRVIQLAGQLENCVERQLMQIDVLYSIAETMNRDNPDDLREPYGSLFAQANAIVNDSDRSSAIERQRG